MIIVLLHLTIIGLKELSFPPVKCCLLLTFLCICMFSLFSLYAGESSHLALNKLKCPHCNYIAKHRRTLKRHLIIHSGVRSFSCDICGKLFTRREHVKRHSLVSLHMHWILSRYHVTCILQFLANTTAFWPPPSHQCTSTLCFVSGSFCSKGVSVEVEIFGCMSYFVMVGGL